MEIGVPTSTAKVTVPTAPTANDNSEKPYFECWNTDNSEYTTKFDFSTALTGDRTLYAKWTDITFSLVAAKDPTCTAKGNIEYYRGSDGNPYLLVNEEYVFKTEAEVTIPAAGHSMSHYSASSGNRQTTGNIKYRHCSVCGKNLSDTDGNTEVAAVSIGCSSHSYSSKITTAPACTEDGVPTHFAAGATPLR